MLVSVGRWRLDAPPPARRQRQVDWCNSGVMVVVCGWAMVLSSAVAAAAAAGSASGRCTLLQKGGGGRGGGGVA